MPDPTSPYNEDAFCREMIQRASSLGHEAALTPVAGAAPPKYFGQDADAILINSFQALPLDAALASGRRCAVRLIDSFADASEPDLRAIKELLLQAHRLLVPSQHLANLVRSWGGERLVSLVPYAYDRVRAHQIALVTMRASRPADFQIVTNCHFQEACRPGLELLLSAIASLRFDWHLTLVGHGPLRQAIQDRVRHILPMDRVLFTGDIPHHKFMELLRCAKAYVNPTGAEGFPALALYSLAEGCPVVAPRFGAVPELIVDGKNGLLFHPGNAVSLSEALVTLWSVRGLSLQLISEGIKTVESHNWDATVKAAFKALEEMVR